MKKRYTNLRVPWHTHLYRAWLAIFVPGERPWHTHLYRALHSIMGNRRYSPAGARELLAILIAENRQAQSRMEDAFLKTNHERERVIQHLNHKAEFEKLTQHITLERERAIEHLRLEFEKIGRHFDRDQPCIVQTIRALGQTAQPATVSVELDFLARSLHPAVTTRDIRLAVFGVAIGTDYRRSVSQCIKSQSAYCGKHALTWATLNLLPNRPKRPLAWYKIPFALQLLRAGYEYILHIDADCLITNPAFKPETLIDRLAAAGAGKCMLVTEDEEGINTGVFLLKNAPDSFRLLDLIWNYQNVIDHQNWEQEALKRVIQDYPQIADLIVIEPDAKQFNSFPCERREFYPEVMNPPNVWSKGDFICHFSGIREPHLALMIKQYVHECGLEISPE